MSDADTVKVPLWMVGLLVTILGAVISGAMYMAETRTLAIEAKERLDRIENGVDQIWGHVMDAGLDQKGKR